MKHVIIFVNEAISRDYLPLFDIKTFKVSASIKVKYFAVRSNSSSSFYKVSLILLISVICSSVSTGRSKFVYIFI